LLKQKTARPVAALLRGRGPFIEIDMDNTTLLFHLRERIDDAHFFTGLAGQFFRRKQFDLARETYEVAVEINPLNAFTHFYLGNSYQQAGHLEAALERYEKGRDLEPRLAVGYWLLASLHEAMKRYDEAEDFYRQALAVQPKDSTTRKNYRRFRARRQQEK
jgi:tetratricopeptide (TPR) repeat protein